MVNLLYRKYLLFYLVVNCWIQFYGEHRMKLYVMSKYLNNA